MNDLPSSVILFTSEIALFAFGAAGRQAGQTPGQHPAGSPKALNATKIHRMIKRYNYRNLRRLAMSKNKTRIKTKNYKIVLRIWGGRRKMGGGRSPKLPKKWSLRTLREKLIKIGAKVIRHSRYVVVRHSPRLRSISDIVVNRRMTPSVLSHRVSPGSLRV